MQTLTLQALLDDQWIDIVNIDFPDSEQNSFTRMNFDYLTDYAVNFLGQDNNHAVSLNYPVDLFTDTDQARWARFLDDIIPSGASRRYWINYLNIDHLPVDQQNFILLKHGTIAPIGNLRIKQSLPAYSPDDEIKMFSINEVADRASDFLEYAQQRGAAAGGATGAGGEAPKLLLRCSNDQRIWIDTYQNDSENQDNYYLVKFPRGQRREIDCDILRTEFHYYHELKAMGFNTIASEDMWLIEGTNYPSLWLPRFDVFIGADGKYKRYAMESVYSILKKAPGSSLNHEETIRTLISKISQSYMVQEQGFQFNQAEFIIEWIRRDLLNIVFGNSDNHGRNTSFLRNENSIWLAPIYDFAPMKADPEGIARTTQWRRPLENGGEYNFNAIAETLSDLLPPDTLMDALKTTARQLSGLKERLIKRGIPQQVIDKPVFGFDYTDQKLHRWGLL